MVTWLCGVFQGAEFNTQKAIQDTLQRSERTKNLINTRATEGNTNIHTHTQHHVTLQKQTPGHILTPAD